MSRETLGNRDPSTLFIINNLGALLKAKGDLAAAESLCREAMEGLRETLGDRHPSTLASISNLGRLLEDKGDLAAAEPLFREALKGRNETLSMRHPDTEASIADFFRVSTALLLLQKMSLLGRESKLKRD